MKIGLMIPTLLHGGAERAICRLSDILFEAGHEVYLIVFDGTQKYYSFSGELIDLNLPNGNTTFQKIKVFWKRVSKVKHIKEQYELEVVISFIAAATFVNCLSRTKSKCIVSQRNYLSKERHSKLKKALIKFCYLNADAIISVSELCKKDLIQNFNLPSDKIYTIYNPYNQNHIYMKSKEDIEKNHKKFFETHEFNIISVGRPEYQKGFLNLIKVVFLLRKQGLDCSLTIVGNGSQIESLKDLSNRLKIQNHIQFVGYQKNPYAYIGNSDIYVMSSLFEGFPNALVEAMCCGIPIISTDCPSGPREIIEGKYNLDRKAKYIEIYKSGILVPKFSDYENWDESHFEESHLMMAEAIRKILICEDMRISMGKNAIIRSREFTYRSCLNEYENLFSELFTRSLR